MILLARVSKAKSKEEKLADREMEQFRIGENVLMVSL